MPEHEQRRLLTILFADLSGFTAFSQNLDPEDIREALDTCYTHLNRIITEHGGTIHKYEGDLVIAIFGLPQSHEDDPERAVKAALEMLGSVPEINRILTTKLKASWDLGLHVGVSMGTVFVGEIGSAAKREYTIIGEEVNLASRLKDSARRGEIMVSARVFRLTRYLFEYRALPPVTFKGFNKPFDVFEPLKVKEKPDPKRGIQGLHSALVGRDLEFGLITKKIADLTRDGKGGMIYVFGEAGLGKSRLFSEVKGHVAKHHKTVKVFEGQCLSYGEKLAFFPVISILAQFFETNEYDALDVVTAKIAGRTAGVLPDKYREVVPYINLLFSIPLAEEMEEKIRYLDGPDLKRQTAMALRDLFVAISRSGPAIIVFEDYHWIDNSTLEFLDYFAETTENAPILVMMLSRPERETDGWRVKENIKKKLGNRVLEVVLRPLDTKDSLQLSDNLLAVSGLAEKDRIRIIGKAEGNPFYLEEVIRSLIDREFLVHRAGSWQPARPLSVKEIPDTIHGVIATRLDRLEPEVKNVLLKAAVIGRSFYARILESLAGIDGLMMSLHLATLEEFEYIRQVAKEPEAEYEFKHQLLQEVAYASLLKKHRTELHHQIAGIIINIFGHRLEEFTEILAHHYDLSDNQEKAIEWLMKAGKKARGRYANDEAIKFYQRVKAIIEGMPEQSGDMTVLLEQANMNLGDIHSLQGRYDAAMEDYGSMYRIATDKTSKATARRKAAQVFFNQSKYDEALGSLAEADKFAADTGLEPLLEKAEIHRVRSSIYQIKAMREDAMSEVNMALALLGNEKPDDRVNNLRARCLTLLGSIHRTGGEYDRAIEIYRQSMEISKTLGDKRSMIMVLNQLGVVSHLKGDYRNGIDLNLQALAISEEVGDKQSIARICGNLGVIFSYVENLEKALEFHKRNLSIAEEIGDKRAIAMSYNNIGRIYLSLNEIDQARRSFTSTIEIGESIGDKVIMGAVYGNLAILCKRTMELDKAEEYLLKTERILTEIGHKELLIVTYQQLAEVLIAGRNALDKALEYAEKGKSLAEDFGSKPGRADVNLALAKIYALRGELEKSKEIFKAAVELYVEIGRKGGLPAAYQDYAEILQELKMPDEAKAYLEKAERIRRELKDSATVSNKPDTR